MKIKKLFKLVLFFIVVSAVIKLSTFGWRFSPDRPVVIADTKIQENLRRHVQVLAGDIGDRSVYNYDNLNRAADYILKELHGLGYAADFQVFQAEGKLVKNIVAIPLAAQSIDEHIVVGAHYDACANPGADDNASAVAILLETARLAICAPTKRAVKFVVFVNEEPPFFQTEQMGSLVYARRAKKIKENIKTVVILESLGYYSNKPNSQQYPLFFGPFYPNRGDFAVVIGNLASRRLADDLAQALRKNQAVPIEEFVGPQWVNGVDFSDHWSFWQEGYPAVMLTDTAFLRNPHYHEPSDLPDTLNYTNMAQIVLGLVEYLQMTDDR